MREPTTILSSLRWLRILSASVVVALLTITFIYAVVYVFVVLYPVFGGGTIGAEQLKSVVLIVSGWGARLFFLTVTMLAALRVARAVEEMATLHGLLVGLLAALGVQLIIYFLYPPVDFEELSIYFALGALGGWLGGVEGRTNLARDVYGATRQIGRADEPSAIATAMGKHLGEPRGHGISLWQVIPPKNEGTPNEHDRDYLFAASWSPRAEEEVWTLDACLNSAQIPALVGLAERPSLTVRTKALSTSWRVAWERQGIRSALLVPLVAPSGEHVGLLMVTSRKRRPLPRSIVRAYLTVGSQAALALENLRLLKEARRAGRQTGVLVERQRLAGEIHDTLAQGFIGIIMMLTQQEEREMKRTPAADASSRGGLQVALQMARESLAEARRLMWALRPEALDRHSLSEALENLAKEWAEKTGVKASASTSGTPYSLLPETEGALLRVAQEALANVHKHAQADRVNITLSYMDERVVLDIADDGVGLDSTQTKTTTMGASDTGGFGLVGMRERIERLGGTLLVESGPGEGTTIVAELPVEPEESEVL